MLVSYSLALPTNAPELEQAWGKPMDQRGQADPDAADIYTDLRDRIVRVVAVNDCNAAVAYQGSVYVVSGELAVPIASAPKLTP